MRKEETLQSEFMSYYDDIVNLARAAFLPVREVDKEDLIAEVLAKSWTVFLKYRDRARLNASFLAFFPIQQARSKMLFAGENSTDVLSPRTQYLGKCETSVVGDFSPYAEAKSVKEDPAEYARVKIDFDEFPSGLTLKQKKVYHLLSRGYRCDEIARKLGINYCAAYERIKAIRRKMKSKLESYVRA